jgi:hypothetical protein
MIAMPNLAAATDAPVASLAMLIVIVSVAAGQRCYA